MDSQKLKGKELKHTARENNPTKKREKKKEWTEKNYKNNLKTRITMPITTYQSIATLNVCGLDAQIKRHKVAKTSLASLYTNNEKSERIIIEAISFAIKTQRIAYLGINLPKETKHLYTENYKTLMKGIKDNTSRCRDIPHSWIEEQILWKLLYYPKQSNRLNAIHIKLPMVSLTELEQIISHFVWEHKNPE